MATHASHHEKFSHVQRLLLRHRWRFLAPAFAVAFAILVAGLLMPLKYEGEAIFEIRNDLVMAEIANRGAPQQFAALKRAAVEELSGVPALDQAVRDLKIVPEPPPTAPESQRQAAELQRRQIVNSIRRGLHVSRDVSTNEVDRIRLTLVHTDADLTRRVLNRLVEHYIDRSRMQVDQVLRHAADFFLAQAERQRQILDGLEQQRLEFEVAHAEVLPQDRTTGPSPITEAEGQLTQAEQALRAADQREAALERELAAAESAPAPASVTMQPNPQIRALQTQIDDYQSRIEQALVVQKMTESHPTVVALRHKVADLHKQLRTLPAEVVASRVIGPRDRAAQIQLQLSHARSDRNAAAAAYAVAQQRLLELRDRNARSLPIRSQYRRLESQAADARRQVEFWNDNLRRVQMALTAELGQRGVTMEFLKPCSILDRPSSPSLAQLLLAAVVLGVGSGAAWLVFRDRIDPTFTSGEQAREHFGPLLLGAVPPVLTAPVARRRWLGRWLGQPLAFGLMAAALVGVTWLDYRTLRAPANHRDAAATSDAAPALPPATADAANPADAHTPNLRTR